MALSKLLRHHFHSEKLGSFDFDSNEMRIISYSKELCEANFDSPEPYLFYLMLNWPIHKQEKEDVKVVVPPHFEEPLFRDAVKKLRSFEEEVWKGSWRKQTHFFLKKQSPGMLSYCVSFTWDYLVFM